MIFMFQKGIDNNLHKVVFKWPKNILGPIQYRIFVKKN